MLREEGAVCSLLRERVPERELAMRAVAGDPDQVATHEFAEIVPDVRPPGDGDEELLFESPPDHGGGLHRAPGRLRQAIETDGDQALDRVGDHELGRISRQPPSVVPTLHDAAVDQRPGHLLHEERIPLGVAEDPFPLVPRHLRNREERPDQLVALLR